jgi:hypothetical protein
MQNVYADAKLVSKPSDFLPEGYARRKGDKWVGWII